MQLGIFMLLTGILVLLGLILDELKEARRTISLENATPSGIGGPGPVVADQLAAANASATSMPPAQCNTGAD